MRLFASGHPENFHKRNAFCRVHQDHLRFSLVFYPTKTMDLIIMESRIPGRGNTPNQTRRSFLWCSKRFVSIMAVCLLTTSQIMNHSPINNNETSDDFVASVEVKVKAKRPVRILWSIFTTEAPDDKDGARYRQLFRNLLDKAVGPERACPLSSSMRPSCELIYTFVVGGANATLAPTSIRDLKRPAAAFLVNTSNRNASSSEQAPFFPDDATHNDITRLDIAENMDQDKSPTWLGYVSKIMDEFDIDYVAKLDTDTLPILDKYFAFVQQQLQPTPTPNETNNNNHRVMVGILADVITWYDYVPKEHLLDRKKYLRSKFGMVTPHYFFRGEFYMLSRQLTKDVYHTNVTDYPQLPNWKQRQEDQLISLLVFKSPGPLHAVMLTPTDKFHRHPIKLEDRKVCEEVWQSEVDRLSNINHTLSSIELLTEE